MIGPADLDVGPRNADGRAPKRFQNGLLGCESGRQPLGLDGAERGRAGFLLPNGEDPIEVSPAEPVDFRGRNLEERG